MLRKGLFVSNVHQFTTIEVVLIILCRINDETTFRISCKLSASERVHLLTTIVGKQRNFLETGCWQCIQFWFMKAACLVCEWQLCTKYYWSLENVSLNDRIRWIYIPNQKASSSGSNLEVRGRILEYFCKWLRVIFGICYLLYDENSVMDHLSLEKFMHVP